MAQGQPQAPSPTAPQAAPTVDADRTAETHRRRQPGSRLGVRSKLFIVSLVLILLVGLASGGYLELQMRRWIGERVETELGRQAATIKQHVELVLSQAQPDLDQLADRLGAASAARITLIAPDGWVAGDSELSPEQLTTLENHGNRPEVLAARAGGKGIIRLLMCRCIVVWIPPGIWFPGCCASPARWRRSTGQFSTSIYT